MQQVSLTSVLRVALDVFLSFTDMLLCHFFITGNAHKALFYEKYNVMFPLRLARQMSWIGRSTFI